MINLMKRAWLAFRIARCSQCRVANEEGGRLCAKHTAAHSRHHPGTVPGIEQK